MTEPMSFVTNTKENFESIFDFSKLDWWFTPNNIPCLPHSYQFFGLIHRKSDRWWGTSVCDWKGIWIPDTSDGPQDEVPKAAGSFKKGKTSFCIWEPAWRFSQFCWQHCRGCWGGQYKQGASNFTTNKVSMKRMANYVYFFIVAVIFESLPSILYERIFI